MKAFDIICPSEWVRVDPARPDGPRIAEIAHEYGLRAYPEFREQVLRTLPTSGCRPSQGFRTREPWWSFRRAA